MELLPIKQRIRQRLLLRGAPSPINWAWREKAWQSLSLVSLSFEKAWIGQAGLDEKLGLGKLGLDKLGSKKLGLGKSLVRKARAWKKLELGLESLRVSTDDVYTIWSCEVLWTLHVFSPQSILRWTQIQWSRWIVRILRVRWQSITDTIVPSLLWVVNVYKGIWC